MVALKTRGRTDNLLVIFSSDNGGERFSDSWPLVGGKIAKEMPPRTCRQGHAAKDMPQR